MYKEFNINPMKRKTTDCGVRAVALATSLAYGRNFEAVSKVAWKAVVEQTCKIALDTGHAPESIEALELLLIKSGFSVGKVTVQKGSSRPTVKSFANDNPNIVAVLRVANHLTVSFKGDYYDIWNCGEKSVYKYWYKRV